MATNDRFSRTVRQWAEEMASAVQDIAQNAIFNLCSDIVESTRVDTGFLRSQWIASFGQPSGQAPTDNDPYLSMYRVTEKMPPGAVFFFTNNAAYAMRMEYGFVGQDSLGRYYNQRGDFNVTQKVARWPTYVREAAANYGFDVRGSGAPPPNDKEFNGGNT